MMMLQSNAQVRCVSEYCIYAKDVASDGTWYVLEQKKGNVIERYCR